MQSRLLLYTLEHLLNHLDLYSLNFLDLIRPLHRTLLRVTPLQL